MIRALGKALVDTLFGTFDDDEVKLSREELACLVRDARWSLTQQAGAEAVGAAREREAVVAWLRHCGGTPWGSKRVDLLMWAKRCIERGEHHRADVRGEEVRDGE